jgi:hypothetical protein
MTVPKRFVDTGIWQKQWYRKLGRAEKVAWFYLLTNCDAVGVWDADLELAEFSIGEAVDWEALREAANGNIEVLDNGKWWVVDFCQFQYGEVKKVSSSNVQRHICSLLSKHGLTERYFPTVAATVQDKDKDKDLDKDKELDKDKDKDKELYHAVEAAFLSRNGDRFTNYGKEGKAIHGLVEKARGRLADDPGAMLHAMLDAFWKLKTGDTSAKGFWRGQPFLPSALSPLWDRVLETMREDVISPELLAIVNGGTR